MTVTVTVIVARGWCHAGHVSGSVTVTVSLASRVGVVFSRCVVNASGDGLVLCRPPPRYAMYTCSCDSGYSGRGCGFTTAESAVRSAIQDLAMQSLANATLAAISTLNVSDSQYQSSVCL